jgi:hypothetical protein
MITLNPLTANTYKVVIHRDDLTEEDFNKLIRKRDFFPAEFVHHLIDLLPPDQTFDLYDHYSMTLYVKD